MRVLVLGANGFVGRRLVAALAASDWATPIAGVRSASKTTGIASVTLDARDQNAIEQACTTTQADAIVNCMANDADSMIKNAEALFAAAAKFSIPVVYLSSMAVYGSSTGLITESHPLQGDVGPYSEAKVRAEELAQTSGANITVFRPGCIYGSGSPQWTDRIAKLLLAKRIGDLGPAGDGCSNIVHVADVASAILAALQRPATGTRAYNLAMPNAPDWNGYFLAFARALNAVPITRIPGWRLKLETKLLAPALKISSMAIRSVPPPIPPSLARLWQQDITLDSTRATQELGVSWTSLSDGLSEASAGLSRARMRSTK
jgi:nucleoside-diphosphate-sugar epimerase